MLNSWIVLIPPFVVLVAVFITRHLNRSLFMGIASAAFIVSKGNLVDTAQITIHRVGQQFLEIDYLYLYGFLLILGMIIALLSHTGGAQAFAQMSAKKLKNATSVETASLLLSSLLFIDDYLSTLTAGYVMRPLSDKFHIPRAKLAFLIHSLSGPLVIIAPISSWVAMITSQLDAAGITPTILANTKIIGDPFFIYLSSIPFTFYSFLLIFSVWIIVRCHISYGPMHYHEHYAQQHQNLFAGKTSLSHVLSVEAATNGTILDLIMPLLLLLALVFGGMLYAGNYWMFGGNNSLFKALQNNHYTFLILLLSAACTFIISTIVGLFRNVLSYKQIPTIISQGFNLMYPAVVMIFLASTLGTTLKEDLLVGDYIAHLMLGKISIALLPLVFFIVSLFIAAITRSSWGTIALLLPITVQMLTQFLNISTPLPSTDIAILFPLLGSIFSGSVCGDHISPISETTIMASTSAGAYPLDHIYTQLPYTIPAIIGCCIAFYLAGIFAPFYAFWSILIPLLAGILACLTTLCAAQWFLKTAHN